MSVSFDVVINVACGQLHARSAVRILQLSLGFENTTILLRTEDGCEATGKSISELLTVLRPNGERMTITAEGKSANEAVSSIARYLTGLDD